MRLAFDSSSWRCAWCWLVLALLGGAGVAVAAPHKADVRVLIDISGSMRQNDPRNLRRPALRMLSGLLQPGTRAGVWTFARAANALVPVAEVDATWKGRTQALSEEIGSPGQFTNIETVLEQASRDWSGEADTHARHLLLLTDGMVDVSKDPRENTESRTRILDSLLPRLKAAGVKVHTIALSERADHELMRRLAGETGGWYQQVEQADELQRVFLRMFETVSQPEALPLQDNRFVVDSSVSEATVLVFTGPDAAPVVLQDPSGETFSDSDLPAGIAWFRDQGYELITISAPQKGEWSLKADIDPDNRVMIITDLKLQTSDVPNHIAVGDQTRLEAFLTSRGRVVDRAAFLRLLEVRAESRTGDVGEALPLNDAGEDEDATAADGRYTLRYETAARPEEVELLVAVDSPTFMRERRIRLAVHEPIEGAIADGPQGPVLALRLESAVMRSGAEVNAWQEPAGGGREPLQLVAAEADQWQAALADPQAPAYVRISGTSVLGNRIERIVGPLMPPGVAAPPPPPEAVSPTPSEVPVDAPVEPLSEAAPPASAPIADEDAEPPQGLLIPLLLFGAVNLVLLVGAAVWLLMRRRAAASRSDSEQELVVLLEDAPDAPSAAGAESVAEEAA